MSDQNTNDILAAVMRKVLADGVDEGYISISAFRKDEGGGASFCIDLTIDLSAEEYEVVNRIYEELKVQAARDWREKHL